MKHAALIGLAFILLLSACGPGKVVEPSDLQPSPGAPEGLDDEDAVDIVQGLVAEKLAAMEEQDSGRYLALIDPNDSEFYTEQRNWFLIYLDSVTSGYTIEVQDAAWVDAGTIVASLHEEYLYGSQGERRRFNYEEKYVLTGDGWKDADLDLKMLETAHFQIKYPQEVERRANTISQAAETACASVADTLGLEPREKITIKLYADQEMLRQSTDIRIAYLFNGWGEAGESIKMYAYRDLDTVDRLIAHELVHKITLEITNSQPSWFAEGMATFFGNQAFLQGNALEREAFTKEELARSISWLEGENLTLLEDNETIALYYAMSAMVLEFMVETYGPDGVRAVLTEFSTYPSYDRGYDFSMEAELQQRLYEAIETTLGVDRDGFNQQWLAWIGAQ